MRETSKSVLVIDTPKNCSECIALDKTYGKVCKAYDDHFISYGGNYYPNKPEWCPLKEMPEQLKGNSSIYYQWGDYEDGYNDCLNEILGEEDKS